MKPALRYSHWLFRLRMMRHYYGVCIGRFILFAESADRVSKTMLRHEMIHQEQMDRHGVVGFYARYFFEYLRARLRGLSHHSAYRANPFEREAYSRQYEET